MTLIQSVPNVLYSLDLPQFHFDLKNLEDDEEGMPHLDTHFHQGELSFAGITFARIIQIINGYTVTFENDQYAVNLMGANSNIADVTNVNQVSVRSFNSAGLVSTATPEEIAQAVHDYILEAGVSQEQAWRLTLAVLTGKSSGGGTDVVRFRAIGDNKDRLVVTVDENGNRISVGTRDGS